MPDEINYALTDAERDACIVAIGSLIGSPLAQIEGMQSAYEKLTAGMEPEEVENAIEEAVTADHIAKLLGPNVKIARVPKED